MNTIHKFTVPKIGEVFHVAAPAGAKPLAVQFQGGQMVFWMQVDDRMPKVGTPFMAVGTGHETPMGNYIGTAQDPGTGFVWHLFQL